MLKCVRVELNGPLKISYRLVPAPLTPFDVTLQPDYSRIIGQTLRGNFKFSQSAIIIEISPIKILGAREVGFPSVRSETRRRLDGRFRLGEARGSMVEADKINAAVSHSEQAIGLEKRWITHDSLVQQVGRL